jgi:hypothetical protein
MNNKVTETIETFILKHFLDVFRNFNIQSGGDINKAQKTALDTLKIEMRLGSDNKKHLLIEELKLYCDFHEHKEGLEDYEEKKALMYIKARDEEVKLKVEEILTVSKNLIRDTWK